MIDFSVETCISLHDAAQRLGLTYQTVWNYSKRKPKPLETIKFGRKSVRTSVEALQRFISQNNEPPAGAESPLAPTPARPSGSSVKARHEAAMESMRTNHGLGTESRNGKAKAKNTTRT